MNGKTERSGAADFFILADADGGILCNLQDGGVVFFNLGKRLKILHAVKTHGGGGDRFQTVFSAKRPMGETACRLR